MKADGAALVTGAGRGLGRAVALELARRGFHVHAGVREPRQRDSLLEAACIAGVRVSAVRLDVTEPTATRS